MLTEADRQACFNFITLIFCSDFSLYIFTVRFIVELVAYVLLMII